MEDKTALREAVRDLCRIKSDYLFNLAFEVSNAEDWYDQAKRADVNDITIRACRNRVIFEVSCLGRQAAVVCETEGLRAVLGITMKSVALN